MEPTTVTVNWSTAIPVLVSAVGPTVTGFMQQFSKEWVAKAPWWAKGLISTSISTLIAMITAYAAQGDAMVAAVGGATLGGIGALNIAFRKGSRGNLEATMVPTATPDK